MSELLPAAHLVTVCWRPNSTRESNNSNRQRSAPNGSLRRLFLASLGLYRLSDETGLPMHELSLRYILSNAAIHTVIPGAQSPAEVDANYQAALKGPLPSDILDAIRKIQL